VSGMDTEYAVVGPHRIPMAGSTCWVEEGWRARVAADGTVRMERA
jgi:hypothetical protein